MDGSLKILLSLLRDLVNTGLVKLSFFTTVPFVCLWPLRGFEWTADFLVPPSQVAPCLSHELDDQLNLLHAHLKNKNTIDRESFRTVNVPLWYPTIGMKIPVYCREFADYHVEAIATVKT